MEDGEAKYIKGCADGPWIAAKPTSMDSAWIPFGLFEELKDMLVDCKHLDDSDCPMSGVLTEDGVSKCDDCGSIVAVTWFRDLDLHDQVAIMMTLPEDFTISRAIITKAE